MQEAEELNVNALKKNRLMRAQKYVYFLIKDRNAFTISELTQAVPFIDYAYLCLLKRRADPGGKAFYEKLLLEIDKKDIIAIIRFSEEGKKVGVRVPGLFFHYVGMKLQQKFAMKLLAEPFFILSHLFQLSLNKNPTT